MAKKEENGNGHETRKGWTRIQTDRPVYKAERGKGPAVQGWLLGMLDMPAGKTGKPWKAFVVRLTEATTCTRNDEKVRCEVGDEILVPANHQLLQHLGRAASHPRGMAEVRITPAGTRKASVGEVSLFVIEVNPDIQVREKADRFLAMGAGAPPALPQASTAAADDDLPF